MQIRDHFARCRPLVPVCFVAVVVAALVAPAPSARAQTTKGDQIDRQTDRPADLSSQTGKRGKSSSGATPAPASPTGPYDAAARRISALTQSARYAEALAEAGKLATAIKQAEGEASSSYASAISWIASLLQIQGRYAEAGPLLERALAIYKQALPSGHPHIATAINNLGYQHQASGRFEEAERFYKLALDLREKADPPNPILIADSLNNVAQVYKRQSRIDEAEPLLRRALEMRIAVVGKDHPIVAQSLQNLAALLGLRLKFVEAERMLRRTLEIRRKSQPSGHPEIAALLHLIADNLYKQERYGESLQLFEEALALRREALPAGHVDIATTMLGIAGHHLRNDRLDEAQLLLQSALKSYQAALPPSHPSIAGAHLGLAEVASRQGRHQDALTEVRLGTKIHASRANDSDVIRLHYLRHIHFAWRAYAEGDKAQRRSLLDEALVTSQRASHTDAAAAVTRMAARFAAKDKGLRDLVRERDDLDSLQVMLEQQLNSALALPTAQRGEIQGRVRRGLSSIARRLADIMDRDLRTRFPDYFNLVRPAPLDSSQIGALLNDDEALVKIVSSYDETYVWAITRDGAMWHRTSLNMHDLSDLVAALRARLDVEDLKRNLTPTSTLFDLGIAHELYRQLLKPLEPLIAGKPNLMIVPSGPLTSLPLHVLVTEPPSNPRPTLKTLAVYRDTAWLTARHAVWTLPSISSLKGLRLVARQPQENQRPMIGFANPQFGPAPPTRDEQLVKPGTRTAILTRGRRAGRSGGYASYWKGQSVDLVALRRDLTPLPETAIELKAVGRSLGAGERDMRLGLAATETAVKRANLSDYRIIYFATHGLVSGEVKGLGEPALVLSLPDKPTEYDDGLLTASEVAQLRLDAEWVVLAACNTASGNGPGAEALSGLARAFFHAGARSMLVSHWRVGSAAAARLTTTTFEARRRDPEIGRAEALRRAMVSYAADRKDAWSAYPAFWAAFTVVGEGTK